MPMSPEDPATIEALEHLGLTSEEAELYLLLVSQGHASVGNLSAKTKLSRTKIYSILGNLQAEGWIKVVSKNPLTYVPLEPKGILEKRKNSVLRYLNTALDKLSHLYEHTRGGFSETVTYRGLKVLTKTEEMISGAEWQVQAITAFLPKEAMGMLEPLLEETLNRGVKIKIVVSEELRGHPVLERFKRVIEVADESIPRAGVVIVDNEVMFGGVERGEPSRDRGDLFGIWTANPEIVAFSRILFDHFLKKL